MRREAETRKRERERVREGAVSLQRARVLQSGARARGVEKEGDEGTDAVSDAGVDRLLFGALLLQWSRVKMTQLIRSLPLPPRPSPAPTRRFPLGPSRLRESFSQRPTGDLWQERTRQGERREALEAKLVQTATGSMNMNMSGLVCTTGRCAGQEGPNWA